jgi:VWFA-related protein
MKTFASALSAIVGVVLVVLPGASSGLAVLAQQATFKSSTDGIWVTASVIDKDGHLLTDLTKDDFEVRDNGTVREITAFRNDVVPFAVAIMVDISLSMIDNFTTTRRAVTEFVGRFEPGDRATIGGFDALPWIAPRFSARPQVLQQFLSDVMAGTPGLCTGDWIDMTSLSRPSPLSRGAPQATTPGYGARPLFGQRLLEHQGTSVWDGLACGVNAVASDGETPRRVVIVLTDGMDHLSSTTPAAVIAHANDAGVMIYTVGLVGSEGLAAGALRAVAEATGGGYFNLNSRADMVDAFGRIAEELRHQYVLAFSAPGLTHASHDVKVRALRADTTTRSKRVFMEAASVATRSGVSAAGAIPIEDQLRAAIGKGSVRHNVPIRVGTALRRGSGSAPIDLAVNVMIPASAAGPLTTMFGLVDESGAHGEMMKSGRKVVAAPLDGAAYRLAFSLPVSPGIYKLRFAAADATGSVGSLETVVAARLATMGPFQVSDLLASWTGADGTPQFLGIEDLPAGAKTINAIFELYPAIGARASVRDARPSPEDVQVRFGLYAGSRSQPLAEKDVVPDRTGGILRAEAPFFVDTLEPGAYVLRATVFIAGKRVGTARVSLRKTARHDLTEGQGPRPGSLRVVRQ